MNSKTTELFWKYYDDLPIGIKKQAKETYKLFEMDPYYPSIHFKQIHSTRPIFSVRISKKYRAIGVLRGEDIIWFWIGSHSDYNHLVKQLRRI